MRGNVSEESERDRKRKGRVEEDGMQKAAGYWDVDAGVEACKSICRMGAVQTRQTSPESPQKEAKRGKFWLGEYHALAPAKESPGRVQGFSSSLGG
jgi:hypothetical protein